MKLNKKEYLLIILLILSWIVFYIYYFNKKESINAPKITDKKAPTDTIQISEKIIKEQKDTLRFIEYWETGNREQIAFKTKSLKSAKVKLFSNYGTRKKMGITSLESVFGINQFFMDFDMSTGFVHPYTSNFYKKLRESDFVLFLERDISKINEGVISYKRIKDLNQSDVLGQNVGFFRQWKLSEIDINENQYVNIKKTSNGFCLQVKQTTNNPFKSYIPLWSKQTVKDGYVDYHQLNLLTNNNGGTVVIIWEVDGEIYFKDIHASIKDIINKLNFIRDKFLVDPVLGIYDAGPMARKFKSNSNNVVYFNEIQPFISSISYVGAGFGYLINQ